MTFISALLAEVVISISLAEVISIPPALAVTCNASLPVPADFITRLASFAPANSIVRSSPAFAAVLSIPEA